jgi:hypothetical protein
MPCYQVQLVSVKFKIKHRRFLPTVAKELGFGYRETPRYVNIGTATVDLERETITATDKYSCNTIKRKYSEVALKEAARKSNWKLFNTQKQNEFVLQKF